MIRGSVGHECEFGGPREGARAFSIRARARLKAHTDRETRTRKERKPSAKNRNMCKGNMGGKGNERPSYGNAASDA